MPSHQEENVSNPDREEKVEVGGKTYTLTYGNRAVRLAEREGAKPFKDFDFERIDDLTTIIWAGLQAKHPGISIEDIDDLFDEGHSVELANAAAAAIQKAFPPAEGNPEGNENRAQRRAQVGAGATSSSKP